MLFYTLFILIVVFSILIYPNNIKLGLFWILVLCFFSMFRGESVGTDTSSYHILYEQEMNILTDSELLVGRNTEIAVNAFRNFLLVNNFSPRYFIFFLSIVTFVFLHLSLKRINAVYNVGLLVFFILFYFDSFNISRQICAASILLFAFTFLFEKGKRSLLFVLFVLLATTFHGSSLLYLSLYLIRYIKINKVIAIIGMILLCIFYIISPINFVSLVSQIENVSYLSVYEDILRHNQQMNFNGVMFFLIRLSAFIVIFINYSKGKMLSKENFMLFCIIIALILSTSLHSDIARIFIPLEFYMIIYMCNLYADKEANLKGLPFVYFLFVNTIHRIYTIWTGAGEIVPYTMDFSF